MIDCEETREAIEMAIQKSLSPEFQKNLSKTQSPYGMGNISQKIKEVLKTADLENILLKKFYDINQT